MNSTSTYSSAIADASNYTRWLVELFAEHLRGDILEVGLGHGGYVSPLLAYGHYTGVDIDKDAVTAAARVHPDCQFETADITSEDFNSRFAGSFDAVVCVNVLEHIEHDALAVRNLVEALRVNGSLILVVPALDILYNDLDRLAGHHRRYTLSRLESVASQAPIEVKRLSYFNPVGGLGWYVNKFRSYSDLDDSRVNEQIRLFDRYLVPVSKALSPFFAKTFGQSALLIGDKR